MSTTATRTITRIAALNINPGDSLQDRTDPTKLHQVTAVHQGRDGHVLIFTDNGKYEVPFAYMVTVAR